MLFQLPRIVVENEQLDEVTSVTSHDMKIPPSIREKMLEIEDLIEKEDNIEKKANFADALAGYYLNYGQLDSAVRLGEQIDVWLEEPSYIAMEIYFKAFERSSNTELAKQYALVAREEINSLLEKDPENLLLKNKLAMTMVVSENPMAGVTMLRDILEIDENNRQAILNLGLLAIQSGQFEKAKARFEKLVAIDSSDHESKLYLATSMIELNKKEQARLLLEEILNSSDSIPAVKVMASDYLNGL